MGSLTGIRAGKAFVLIEAIDRTGHVLNAIKGRIGRVGADISNMGRSMALRSAAALTPVGMSTKTFADFDDAMKKVEARSSGTGDEMMKIREQAKMLGDTTAFTATQIGNLQNVLAQKGFDRNQILKMTEPIMLLARAGEGEDLGQDAIIAANLVSGTLKAFQMDASKAAHVADMMAVAVNASNFTLEEMVTALSYASPAMADFGGSIEDMLAVTAAMRDLNIDASIAGTALRNMMNYASKADEQKKFNEAFKEFTGNVIKFTDAKGNLVNIRDLLTAIFEGTKDLGTAKRSELFDMLFETRASVPARAVGKSVESMARMLTALKDSDGAAKKMSDTMESGLGGSFRMLFSRVEALGLAIGEALAPALMSVIEITKDWLQVGVDWVKQNAGTVVLITSAIAAFGALGVAMLVVGQALIAITPLFTLGAALTGITASAIHFAAPWAAAAAGIYMAASAIADFIGKKDQFDSAIASGTSNLTNFVGRVFTELANNLFTIFDSISAHWEGSINQMARALKSGDIQTASEILAQSIKVTWLAMAHIIQTSIETVANESKKLWAEMTLAPFRWYHAVGEFLTRSNNPEDATDPKQKRINERLDAQAETIKQMEALINASPDATAKNQRVKEWLDELNKLNGMLQKDFPSPSKPESTPALQWMEKFNELKKAGSDLIGVQPTVSAPKSSVEAAERASIEAVRQFAENRAAMMEQQDALLTETKKQTGLLEKIEENMAATTTSLGMA